MLCCQWPWDHVVYCGAFPAAALGACVSTLPVARAFPATRLPELCSTTPTHCACLCSAARSTSVFTAAQLSLFHRNLCSETHCFDCTAAERGIAKAGVRAGEHAAERAAERVAAHAGEAVAAHVGDVAVSAGVHAGGLRSSKGRGSAV